MDIVFDDSSAAVDEEALADIFDYLPNVAVSNIDSITYLHSVIYSLHVRYPSSLRVLDWSTSEDNVPEPRMLRRVEGLVKDPPEQHTLNFPGL